MGGGIDVLTASEPEHRRKLRCPRDLVRAQVPIPETDARFQLGEPQPLLALTHGVFGSMTFDDVRCPPHVEIEQTHIPLIGPVHCVEIGGEHAERR